MKIKKKSTQIQGFPKDYKLIVTQTEQKKYNNTRHYL